MAKSDKDVETAAEAEVTEGMFEEDAAPPPETDSGDGSESDDAPEVGQPKGEFDAKLAVNKLQQRMDMNLSSKVTKPLEAIMERLDRFEQNMGNGHQPTERQVKKAGDDLDVLAQQVAELDDDDIVTAGQMKVILQELDDRKEQVASMSDEDAQTLQEVRAAKAARKVMDAEDSEWNDRYGNLLPSGSRNRLMGEVLEQIEADPYFDSSSFDSLMELASRKALAEHRKGKNPEGTPRKSRSTKGTKLTHDGADTTASGKEAAGDDFDEENGITLGMYEAGGTGL